MKYKLKNKNGTFSKLDVPEQRIPKSIGEIQKCFKFEDLPNGRTGPIVHFDIVYRGNDVFEEQG